ncbi:MAG: hypothetical protein KKA92_01530, partial [Gammaproteobacteria bacterium]|nr:hypothetical protein [Gammaproteobacteria bacterium]
MAADQFEIVLRHRDPGNFGPIGGDIADQVALAHETARQVQRGCRGQDKAPVRVGLDSEIAQSPFLHRQPLHRFGQFQLADLARHAVAARLARAHAKLRIGARLQFARAPAQLLDLGCQYRMLG